MRFPIGLKIFGIAVGLLILMAAAALLSMRMTRAVDGQLAIIDQNYFPAYVALAQANIRSVEESAFVRRLLLPSNVEIMPRNSINCVSRLRPSARGAKNGLPMRGNISTGRSPIHLISTTTSLWRG
jgi:hypothetical protein